MTLDILTGTPTFPPLAARITRLAIIKSSISLGARRRNELSHAVWRRALKVFTQKKLFDGALLPARQIDARLIQEFDVDEIRIKRRLPHMDTAHFAFLTDFITHHRDGSRTQIPDFNAGGKESRDDGALDHAAGQMRIPRGGDVSALAQESAIG